MTDSGGSKRSPPLKHIRGVRESLQQGQILMRVSPGIGPVQAVPMSAALTYILQGPGGVDGGGKHQFEATLDMRKHVWVGWFILGPGITPNAAFPGPMVPAPLIYPSKTTPLDYAYCETPPLIDTTFYLVFDLAAYRLQTSFPFGIFGQVLFYAGQNVGLVNWSGFGSGGETIIRPKHFYLVSDANATDTKIAGINITTIGDM